MKHLCIKCVQYNEYVVNAVVSDDTLDIRSQSISSQSAEYATMHFQLFMG